MVEKSYPEEDQKEEKAFCLNMSSRLQLISLKKKEFKDIMSANKISTEYFTIYYQKKVLRKTMKFY